MSCDGEIVTITLLRFNEQRSTLVRSGFLSKIAEKSSLGQALYLADYFSLEACLR